MKEFDVIIIGAGPAGYVSAIRAGQLGLSTAIVEMEKLGGMCLNWGCIPSKTLLESAKLFDKTLHAATFGIEGIDTKAVTFNWKKATGRKDRIVMRLVKGVEFLLKKNNVETITGVAKVTGSNIIAVDDAEFSAKNIIIATGSRPAKGRMSAIDQSKITEVDELFAAPEIGGKFLVYGGNASACETAYMLRLLGKKVTMVAPDKALIGFLDDELSKFVLDKFSKSGIKIYLEREITKDGTDGVYAGDDFIECDQIINCSDRTAVIPELQNVDIAMENDFVKTNEFMQTNIPSIYAIGDITGQITAHAGSAQGTTAVNHIAGIKQPFDPLKIPMNIYLDPELASIGLTEEQLKEQGIEYRKGEFPLTVNGKAMAEGTAEGFVKVLAESKYGEILGVHIVAPSATDMIAEAATIMQLEGTLEDVGRVVHAHPTVSEALLEATFKAMDKPLHM
ncbi:MAG: dihydrolipoyl dehydrogenase [Candidatus Zixiibacteriota bacterium]